jgi:hypothetical protein
MMKRWSTYVDVVNRGIFEGAPVEAETHERAWLFDSWR